MKLHPQLLIMLLLASSSCNPNWEATVKAEVSEMEKFMVETELEGNYEKQLNVYSEAYGYIDISGKRVGKEQLKERRSDDHKKSLSLIPSEIEIIPLSPGMAISRGRWDQESIYYGGIPRISSSRYMSVWKKENGNWKLFADQVTDIVNREINRPAIDLERNELEKYEGTFILQRDPSLEINLRIEKDTLTLYIPGQLAYGIPFLPSYNELFYSPKRPWEIDYTNHDTLIFHSWGQKTKGVRK